MSDRLLVGRYVDFLAEAKDVSHASVHGAFRVSSSCDMNIGSTDGIASGPGSMQCSLPWTLEKETVAAVLQLHVDWDSGPRGRAAEVLHHLPHLLSPGQETSPAYSERELWDAQLQDGNLSRVIFYVERHRKPSRRERVGEPLYVKR